MSPHVWSALAMGRSCSDRKSTRLNSSHLVISYAVFCLKKKKYSHLFGIWLSLHCSHGRRQRGSNSLLSTQAGLHSPKLPYRNYHLLGLPEPCCCTTPRR